MITILDIFKKISGMIETSFNVPIYSRNTAEGFSSECFYVEIVSPRQYYKSPKYITEEFSARITFIPKTEHETKRLFDVKNTLQSLFKLNLKIKDGFFIEIAEKQFTFTTNNALELLMPITYTQEIEEANSVLMNEIIIK